MNAWCIIVMSFLLSSENMENFRIAAMTGEMLR